jgi:hypothetical protein
VIHTAGACVLRNIDLSATGRIRRGEQSVRPAGLKPAQRDSGENLRWEHRAQPYVPGLANFQCHLLQCTRGFRPVFLFEVQTPLCPLCHIFGAMRRSHFSFPTIDSVRSPLASSQVLVSRGRSSTSGLWSRMRSRIVRRPFPSFPASVLREWLRVQQDV